MSANVLSHDKIHVSWRQVLASRGFFFTIVAVRDMASAIFLEHETVCLLAGVSGLHRADADKGMADTYALLVADTVWVPGEGELAPEKEKERVFTLSCPKSWTDIAYFFKVLSIQPGSTHLSQVPAGIARHLLTFHGSGIHM